MCRPRLPREGRDAGAGSDPNPAAQILMELLLQPQGGTGSHQPTRTEGQRCGQTARVKASNIWDPFPKASVRISVLKGKPDMDNSVGEAAGGDGGLFVLLTKESDECFHAV